MSAAYRYLPSVEQVKDRLRAVILADREATGFPRGIGHKDVAGFALSRLKDARLRAVRAIWNGTRWELARWMPSPDYRAVLRWRWP